MSICLNPSGGHIASRTDGQGLMCTTPNCGFLMAGARIEHCQVTNFIRRYGSTDSYIAAGMRERKLVKVFRHCPAGSLMRLERLQSLQHPYIHRCEHTGWIGQENSLYLLSRYEEAGSLARYVRAAVPLPIATIATFVLQIAQALQYMHGQNLGHGYLRPENCLIVDPETVQISDFYHVFLFREGAAASPLSLVPEQLRGENLASSDQYALAVLALQLLACHLPPQLRRTNDGQSSTPIEQIPQEMALAAFPALLQQILRKALDPLPTRRFPDVMEFASTLYNALDVLGSSGPLKTVPKIRGPFTSLPSPARQMPQSGPLVRKSGSSRGTSGPMPPLSPSQVSSRSPENPPAPSGVPTKPSLHGAPGSLPGHTAAISVVRWAPDGMHLASSGPDRRIMIWFVRQRIGTPLGTVTGHDASVKALSWAPDGRVLASAAEDASIRLWHITTAPTFQIHAGPSWWGHDGEISALEWSPGGARLASGGRDQMVRLWDGQGNSLLSWQAHGRGGVTTLTWSGDEQMIATGGVDRQILLWDAYRGNQIGQLTGHTDEIRCLRWNPQGKLLASSAGKRDPQIYLWDTQEKRRQAVLSGHKREVTGLFWSADGTWLISVSADRTMKCWNTAQPDAIPPDESIPIEGTPIAMDGTSVTQMLALGTSAMLVFLLQLRG